MRGNPRDLVRIVVGGRSIPACAGEPCRLSDCASFERVYPRVWRGNLLPCRSSRPLSGSIPACAGEPTFYASVSPLVTVYPRVCGGTCHGRRLDSQLTGLSPRVRGTLIYRNVHDHYLGLSRVCGGTIGDPLHRWPEPGLSRVCGGTEDAVGNRPDQEGLSPRVRGNHIGTGTRPSSGGSIPACAGEPGQGAYRYRRLRVYPRVCGGTFMSPSVPSLMMGLSPRVRGNRCELSMSVRSDGSIPACAGEPRVESGTARSCRVYPRVCGGTDRAALGPLD